MHIADEPNCYHAMTLVLIKAVQFYPHACMNLRLVIICESKCFKYLNQFDNTNQAVTIM